jgi:hypothetical protein
LWAGQIIEGQKPCKEFTMKKMMCAVLAAAVLAVLAGCASMVKTYTDERTTVFLPDGTVQWAATVNTLANYSIHENDPGYRERLQKHIADMARLTQEELEQQGKKVHENPDAAINPMYQRFEERLRTLPPGTKLVWGGFTPDDVREVVAVAFLNEDGSFGHYVIEN